MRRPVASWMVLALLLLSVAWVAAAQALPTLAPVPGPYGRDQSPRDEFDVDATFEEIPSPVYVGQPFLVEVRLTRQDGGLFNWSGELDIYAWDAMGEGVAFDPTITIDQGEGSQYFTFSGLPRNPGQVQLSVAGYVGPYRIYGRSNWFSLEWSPSVITVAARKKGSLNLSIKQVANPHNDGVIEITGQVHDTDDRPVPGALVAVADGADWDHTRTDQSGQYQVTARVPGGNADTSAREVDFSLRPYIRLRASKAWLGADERPVEDSHWRETVTIRGKVTALSGAPVERAAIELVGGANPDATWTDSNGEYVIQATVPGGSGAVTYTDIDFVLPEPARTIYACGDIYVRYPNGETVHIGDHGTSYSQECRELEIVEGLELELWQDSASLTMPTEEIMGRCLVTVREWSWSDAGFRLKTEVVPHSKNTRRLGFDGHVAGAEKVYWETVKGDDAAVTNWILKQGFEEGLVHIAKHIHPTVGLVAQIIDATGDFFEALRVLSQPELEPFDPMKHIVNGCKVWDMGADLAAAAMAGGSQDLATEYAIRFSEIAVEVYVFQGQVAFEDPGGLRTVTLPGGTMSRWEQGGLPSDPAPFDPATVEDLRQPHPAVDMVLSDFEEGEAAGWVDDGSDRWAVWDGAYAMGGDLGDAGRYTHLEREVCDFTYSARARKIAGDGTELSYGYGLYARSDGAQRDYYELNIVQDGWFMVGRGVNGAFTKLVDWTPSEALNQGLGAWNSLAVAAIGDDLYFLANDVLLAEVEDTTFRCGQVGLFAVDGAESDEPDAVEFDNVLLVPRPPTRYYLPLVFKNMTPDWEPPPTQTPTATSTSTPTPTSTSTPTSTPTPTPTATDTAAGWITLLDETFEGAFPGDWQVVDANPEHGEYYWGQRDCEAHTGSYGAWAVGAGADGVSLACGADYPAHAESWMVWGPFSLVDATAAQLQFKLWIYCENDLDWLMWGASTDGSNFEGPAGSGNSQGWVDATLDLTDVPGLGNLAGQEQVWIGLNFHTNESAQFADGAHIDDLLLRKYVPGALGRSWLAPRPQPPSYPDTLHIVPESASRR